MNDEELDRVYRDYFRREVPAEMPPLRKSELASPPSYGSRSRATLAVAIAAFFCLGLWLSGNVAPTQRPAKNGSPSLLNNAEADGKKILDAAKEPPMPEMP